MNLWQTFGMSITGLLFEDKNDLLRMVFIFLHIHVSMNQFENLDKLYGQENTSSLIPSGTQGYEPETNPGPSVLKGLKNVSFE